MPIALIIDDEPEANRLLARLVQLKGFQSVPAFTGSDAAAALAGTRPDIIFLDLMLPDVSGFEVCESLKAARDTYSIPIVMNTARLAAENRLQSYRHGADAFIQKPYTPDQIFNALKQAPIWRDLPATSPAQGTIALQGHDEAAAHQAIGRLWGLLLHRTIWEAEQVRRLVMDLGHWAHDLFVWTKSRPDRPLATLAYEVRPDRVELLVHDEAGWGPHVDLRRLGPPGRFDEVLEEGGATRFRVQPR